MAAGQGTSRHGRDGRAVDAVFFDLFGTLLDLGGLVEDCETAASGRGRELAARWRVRQLEFSWLRTTMGTFVDFDRVTADALEVAQENQANRRMGPKSQANKPG
jgi:HAD superfamily hydrolase (TIGR01493 family)